MIPILFSDSATTFTTYGVGPLPDAITCKVTEELNGTFELEMTYPITGLHYIDISERMIIYSDVRPRDTSQAFRIYKVTKPHNGVVTIYARHISYDLSGIIVKPFTATTVTSVFSGFVENASVTCPFTFHTNVVEEQSFTVSVPSSIRSLLGTNEGCILDVFGGEYTFDNYKVILNAQRGTDRGVRIEYGVNLTSLTQDRNVENVYTGIYPYYASTSGSKTKLITLTDTSVCATAPLVMVDGTYSYTKILAVDLSSEFDRKPTQAKLYEKALKYIEDNNIGVPEVSLQVSYEELTQQTDSELYKRTDLGDTVTVYFPNLGVNSKSRCVKTIYDVLLDKYESIELGESETTLAETIAVQSKETKEKYASVLNYIDWQTQVITGNKGGALLIHDSDEDGYPDELLIMDTMDISTAQNVWRFNQSGWGHSSNGYNGSFNMAATLDGGFSADFITTGCITSIEYNNGNGTFYVSPEGALKCTKADVTGKVTATSGLIGPWNITSSSIWYGSAVYGNASGIYLGTSGLSLGSAFKVSNAGALNCTGASVSGTLTAGAGSKIGPWVVTDTSIYYKNSAWGNANGIYLGTSGLSLGSAFKVAADGTTTITKGSITIGSNFSVTTAGVLTASNGVFTGKVTATTGAIGPWNITSSSIWYGNSAFGNSAGIYFGTSGLSLGSKTKIAADGTITATALNLSGSASTININGAFIVTSAGALTATNATLTGKVTASSGAIGPWNITSSSIWYGSNAFKDSSGMYFGTSGISIGSKFSVTNAGYAIMASGEIGGFTIGSTYISSKSNSSAVYTGMGGGGQDIVFFAGSSSASGNTSSAFWVNWAGHVEGSSVKATSSVETPYVSCSGQIDCKTFNSTGDVGINGQLWCAGAGRFGNLTVKGTLTPDAISYSGGIEATTITASKYVTFSKSLTVSGSITAGSLEVSGNKNRIVTTTSYGVRKLYSMESPSPVFSDFGSAVTDEEGIALIYFDDVFYETVNTVGLYQVLISKCGEGDLWIAEKQPEYFIVKGTANLEFDWEAKIKQRGMENYCMEEKIDDDPDLTDDTDEELDEYTKTLEKDDDTAFDIFDELYFEEDGVA